MLLILYNWRASNSTYQLLNTRVAELKIDSFDVHKNKKLITKQFDTF